MIDGCYPIELVYGFQMKFLFNLALKKKYVTNGSFFFFSHWHTNIHTLGDGMGKLKKRQIVLLYFT